MGVLSEAAILIAASLSIYARIVGATYLTVILVLISSSAVQLALFLAYHSLIHRWFIAPTKVLPHPKNTPFILGNLLPFLIEPWGVPIVRWQHSVTTSPNGLFRVFMGPFDYVVPKAPHAIYEALSQYSFEKPALARQGLERSLGVGLVVAEGEVHRQQRKMMTPIFGLGRNRRLVPQVWATATVLCQKIENLVSQAEGFQIVEVHSLTMATSLDVLGATTLGVDLDSIQHPERSILRAYKMVYPTPNNPTTVDKIVSNIFGTIIPPSLLFRLPSRTIREYHKGMAELRNFYIQHIRMKKQDIKAGSVENVELREKDILSALVANGLTDEDELLSHLLTTMAAGHDTTAVTLDWALFRLAKHSDVQDRLRVEVEQAIGDNGTVPSLETLNSMKYLHAFLMEVLRFYPAVPLMARSAVEYTTIGGVRISRGQGLLISPYAINRCRELWGDDADEFDVRRWEFSHTGGASSPYAFSTFSMGPRYCIGKELALTTIKTLLVALLRRFRFEEVVPGWHPPFLKDTTLKARGLKIKFSAL